MVLHKLPPDASANALMGIGMFSNWALAIFNFMDSHSGFFVSFGVLISTGITAWGAMKAKDKRRGIGESQ
jgi:hypothetical protein